MVHASAFGSPVDRDQASMLIDAVSVDVSIDATKV